MGGGSAEGWEGGRGVPYDGLKPIVLELFFFLPHLQHMLSVLCEAKCQVVLPEVSICLKDKNGTGENPRKRSKGVAGPPQCGGSPATFTESLLLR